MRLLFYPGYGYVIRRLETNGRIETERREEGNIVKTFLKATYNRKVWTTSLLYLFLKLQDEKEEENPKEMA